MILRATQAQRTRRRGSERYTTRDVHGLSSSKPVQQSIKVRRRWEYGRGFCSCILSGFCSCILIS